MRSLGDLLIVNRIVSLPDEHSCHQRRRISQK
jgi:hypothetical protein